MGRARRLSVMLGVSASTVVVGHAHAVTSPADSIVAISGEAFTPRGEFAKVMLDEHNAARRAFGVAPMRYDPALAADARTYAQELARKRKFRHSTREQRRGVQGENLWMGTRNAFYYRTMVRDWVDERKWFRPGVFPDVTTTRNWSDVGHYTAIVWPTTTAVGCGLASNSDHDYLVCRYSPAGNVAGRRLG